jgi:hypothetical protein
VVAGLAAMIRLGRGNGRQCKTERCGDREYSFHSVLLRGTGKAALQYKHYRRIVRPKPD